MMRSLRRFATRRGLFRRCSASFLLFLFVTDIGSHLAFSLLASPEPEGSVLLLSGDGHFGNPEEPSGCGIPGHSGTPFHHHHFPAIVTQAHLALRLTTLESAPGTSVVEAVHTSLVSSQVRAPPKGF